MHRRAPGLSQLLPGAFLFRPMGHSSHRQVAGVLAWRWLGYCSGPNGPSLYCQARSAQFSSNAPFCARVHARICREGRRSFQSVLGSLSGGHLLPRSAHAKTHIVDRVGGLPPSCPLRICCGRFRYVCSLALNSNSYSAVRTVKTSKYAQYDGSVLRKVDHALSIKTLPSGIGGH